MVVGAEEEEEGAAKKQLHHKEEGPGAKFVSRVAVMVSCDHGVTSGEGAQ